MTCCQWKIQAVGKPEDFKEQSHDTIKYKLIIFFEVNYLSLTQTFNKFHYTQRFLSAFVMEVKGKEGSSVAELPWSKEKRKSFYCKT